MFSYWFYNINYSTYIIYNSAITITHFGLFGFLSSHTMLTSNMKLFHIFPSSGVCRVKLANGHGCETIELKRMISKSNPLIDSDDNW